MRHDLRFARQLERDIIAAITEDRCDQLDLPGMIDDLATTYEDIVVRLRRVQERLASAGSRPVAERGYLILPHIHPAQQLIEEVMTQ